MMDDPIGINLLVSYVYVDGYETLAHEMPRLTGTMLDSGAFSAWRSGAKIDIDALIAESKKQRWKESVCLDVIGKPAQSVANAIYMQDRGSPAFPVFHFTDPWEHLDEYKRRFDKDRFIVSSSAKSLTMPVAQLAGSMLRTPDLAAQISFVRWLGRSEKMLIQLSLPLGADTASWNNRPNRFGKYWKGVQVHVVIWTKSHCVQKWQIGIRNCEGGGGLRRPMGEDISDSDTRKNAASLIGLAARPATLRCDVQQRHREIQRAPAYLDEVELRCIRTK